MVRRFGMLTTLGAWLALACSAEAALVITIGTIHLDPGASGYLDVTIQSDNAIPGDPLQAYGFEYRITRLYGTGRLEFVDPQPTGFLTDSQYVFFGNSFDYVNTLPVGGVSQTDQPADTFIGGDSTNDGENVTVTTTSKLLTRLQVTSAAGLPTQPDDVYQVALISGGSTFFQDKDSNDILYSSTSGRVYITPEPGSLVAVVSGGVVLACLGWRRARRKKAAASPHASLDSHVSSLS